MFKTIYLSGNNSVQVFNNKTVYFQTLGHRVINAPSPHDPDNKRGIRDDIADLLKCDTIYMMAGWSTSQKSKLENYIAKQLGMLVIYEEIGNSSLLEQLQMSF